MEFAILYIVFSDLQAIGDWVRKFVLYFGFYIFLLFKLIKYFYIFLSYLYYYKS